MTITMPALTPAQHSLFLTLGNRALDSRLPHPFLGDPMAMEVVEKTGFDLDGLIKEQGAIGKLFSVRTLIFEVVIRAKRLDDLVRQFVAKHPDGIVLDLGAGLDSRILRVDPPSTVDWYDIDFPEVIALRPQVLPERARSHEIGADLADPRWLDAVPTGRPAIAVADGVVAFLPIDGLASMLNGIVQHFPGGELGFNAYTTYTVNVAKRYGGTKSIAAGMVNPGFDDPREPERWAPGLKLAESIHVTRAPEVDGLGWAMRAWYRLAGRSDSLSAKGTTVLHYTF